VFQLPPDSSDQVIKYKTDQAADVKKVEKLNNEFFKLMSLKKLDPASLAAQEGTRCRGVSLGVSGLIRQTRAHLCFADEPAVKEPEVSSGKKKKTSKRS
jgi:hypothetical protein